MGITLAGIIGFLGLVIGVGAWYVYESGLAAQHFYVLLILISVNYLILAFFMSKQRKLLKSFNEWQANHVKVHEDLNEKLKQVYERLR